MSEIVQNQYHSWQAENSGKWIYNGYIYVGKVDLDPEIKENQVRVFYIDENEQEIDLAQPIRTNSSGFTVISETNSTVIQVRTDDDYSVKALNRNKSQEWYIPKASTLAPVFDINIEDVEGLESELKSKVTYFDNLDDALNESDPLKIFDGQTLNIRERSTGNGGGANWDVVLTTSVIPNGADIVQSVAIPNLSLKLRVDKYTTILSYGAATNGSEAVQAAANNGLINWDGSVTLNESVVLPDGCEVKGSGDMIVNGITGLICEGSTTQVTSTTTEYLIETREINVASVSGLAPNDYILIKSPWKADTKTPESGDWQLDGDDEGVYYEEFSQIRSISGNKLILGKKTVLPRYPSGSIIEKVNFKTVNVESDINVIREGNSSGGVKLLYCVNSSVSLGTSISKTYTGADIVFERCLTCVGVDSIYTLNPDTPVNYLGNNPSAENYFSFNSFKSISSNNTGFKNCTVIDGTQCFDLTYRGAPSIECYIESCTSIRARHNMMTTHPNSVNCWLTKNTGVDCQRGISARGRADLIKDNVIKGVTKGVTIDGNNNNYGVALADGFNKGAIVLNNDISGFYRGVLMNTANNDGFSENTQKVKGGRISNCTEGIRVERSEKNPNRDLYEACGQTIEGVTFEYIETHAIRNSNQYTNNINVINCNFPSDLPDGKYCLIQTEENCKAPIFSGNTLPKDGGKYLYLNGITDPSLGDGTWLGVEARIENNNYRKSDKSNVVFYKDDFIENFEDIDDGESVVYLDRVSTDTDIDCSLGKVFRVKNTTAQAVEINNISNGKVGQIIYLTTSGSTVGVVKYMDAGGNISLKTGLGSIEIDPGQCLVLHCVSNDAPSGAWCQSE